MFFKNAVCALTIVTFTSSIALAQTEEKDVGTVITPLKKGQVAPFSGNLLSPKAIASMIAQLDAIQQQVKIETDKVRGEERAQCDFKLAETKTQLETDKKVLQAQIDENVKRFVALNDVIKQQEANKTNTTLWVSLGIAGGLIVGVGLSAAIIAATK